MTPQELHRGLITAIAFGDHERENRLRARLTGREHQSAFEYLLAVVVVCLGHRFGDHDPVDHAELGRLMAELRAAGPEFSPPPNRLEVEAVIRGIRGATHLLEEIGHRQQRESLAFVLRYLADAEPAVRDDFDTMVDHAQELQRRWLLGG